MKSQREISKELLVEYFEAGCKGRICENVGIEVEHFVVKKDTMETVSYYGDGGIGEILPKLAAFWSDSTLTGNGNCLGFTTEDFAITLEPAAQLEISMRPTSSIEEVKAIYEDFRAKTIGLLEEYGYLLINEGYQPVSRVEDLAIIPKERYQLMNAHFRRTGDHGINMMRGTASVQASVDYDSSADFSRKIQVAYSIMPVIKLIMDNTKHYEGAPNKGLLKRTTIWNDVDAARCGIIPGVLEGDYPFSRYADYILGMPPIFLPFEGCDVPTGDAVVEDLFSDKAFDPPMIEHLISMAFPDVRLKKYIEIRGADCTEPDRVYAYAALIKGLMYEDSFLNKLQDCKEEWNLTEKSIKESEESLMRNGWQGNIYGHPAAEVVQSLLDVAQKHLPEKERPFLAPFYDLLAANR